VGGNIFFPVRGDPETGKTPERPSEKSPCLSLVLSLPKPFRFAGIFDDNPLKTQD
jgi:hypothetical protein